LVAKTLNNINNFNKGHTMIKHINITQYSNKFDEWWDPENFDWISESGSLAKYHRSDFDKWWDPERFNWADCGNLAIYCSQHFDKWWDPNRVHWFTISSILASTYADRFDDWFDRDLFHPNGYIMLAKHCSDHFDKWWDKFKYDMHNMYNLIRYCNCHFDKWFDPDYFNCSYLESIIEYCPDKFDKWFRPDKFDFANSGIVIIKLIRYHNDNFDKWWPELHDRIKWKDPTTLNSLIQNSRDHVHKWYPEVKQFIHWTDDKCTKFLRDYGDSFTLWFTPKSFWRYYDYIKEYLNAEYREWVQTRPKTEQLGLLEKINSIVSDRRSPC
jgi:hypothetical protein